MTVIRVALHERHLLFYFTESLTAMMLMPIALAVMDSCQAAVELIDGPSVIMTR